jgi:predicted amidophosphoribosyltransferase
MTHSMARTSETVQRENVGGGAGAPFVWPPRTPVIGLDSTPPQRSHSRPSPLRSSGEPDSSLPQRNSPLATADSHPDRLSSAWAEVEHTWLDLTAAPLDQRMAAEYWAPDSPSDYCPRCGLSVGRHDRREDGCVACADGQVPRPPWQRIIRLGEYEAPLSQWVCEVKFTRWRKLGRDLGRLLGDSIAEQMVQARESGEIPAEPPLIVPVPMSLLRRFSRGIDHTLAIARGVADRTGGRIVQPIRRDHRPSQTHIAPSRRPDNIANSVHPRRWWLRPSLAGRLVIVLDDVATTSSTLRAACRAVAACPREEWIGKAEAVRGKPAIIWAAVLARTQAGVDDLSFEKS